MCVCEREREMKCCIAGKCSNEKGTFLCLDDTYTHKHTHTHTHTHTHVHGSVIYRLIVLLSQRANLEADNDALRKQAESASRMALQNLSSTDKGSKPKTKVWLIERECVVYYIHPRESRV